MSYEPNLLEAQAYTNAVSRLNYPSYGVGYGMASREAYDGTVTNANIEANRQVNLLHHNSLTAGQIAIQDRIAESGQNTLNIIQNNALTAQLNGFRDFVTSAFNSNERNLANLALQNQECCCEIKTAVAALDAKVECNEKVRQAEIATKTQTQVEQLLAKCGS